jgi:hypothetical protein
MTTLLYERFGTNIGGVKQGELMIFTAGNRSGKSYLDAWFDMSSSTKFTILDQAQVDSDTWYTVSCTKEVCIWMREQSEELQYWHTDLTWNKIDIHEKLYTLMALKWS